MGVGKVGLSTISVQVSPIHIDNDLLSKDHSAYLLHNHLVLKFGTENQLHATYGTAGLYSGPCSCQ